MREEEPAKGNDIDQADQQDHPSEESEETVGPLFSSY